MQSTLTSHKIQKRQIKSDQTVDLLIPVETMKLYLLEANSDQDEVIADLIRSATLELEKALDYIISTSEDITQYYDQFPADGKLVIWHKAIDPESVTLEYEDENGDWQTIDEDDYYIDHSAPANFIKIRSSASWPDDKTDDDMSIRITFAIDAARTRTADIIGAIRKMVADVYEGREIDWNNAMMVSSVDRVIQANKMMH